MESQQTSEADGAELVALLISDAEGRQRAYTQLEDADAAVAAAPVVVDALVDGVLCSSVIGSGEYQQVSTLVGRLMLREKGDFALEMVRNQRWIRAWEAPALLAVATKPPAEMTRNDALTAGILATPMM
eukprot:COSAG02_NODE_39103_length_421_cov_0.639752_2_plen_128_part_01